METSDASEIDPRKINAREREVLKTQKDDDLKFPIGDGTAKLSGRYYAFREKISEENFKSESGESHPTEPTDDAEARLVVDSR